MVVLWLCSVLHPCQRMTIQGDRYRLKLPQNDWLQRLLQHEQIEVSWADPKPEPSHKFYLVGLMQVDFSQIQAWKGPLTAWSREGATLHDYYHCPVDSFIVQASSIFCLDESLPVYHKMDARARESTVKGSDGIFLPVGVSSTVNGSRLGSLLQPHGASSQPPRKCQLRDVLQSWGIPVAELGEIAAHMVPQPISELMLKGKWRDLLCLSRWAWFKSPQPRSGFGEEFSLPEALKAVIGHHEQLEEPEPLELQHLETMLQHLRRWSPAILAQCDSEEDAAGEQLLLESFADWLRQLKLYFSPHFATSLTELRSQIQVRRRENVHGHQRYSDNQLVGMVLFGWHLRDNVGVKEALPSALQAMFPGFFAKTTTALGAQVFSQSKSLLRSAQLSLDIALMVLRRQRFESQQSVERYGWADSSPVAQADWIVCKHQTVPTRSCIELFQAYCELRTLEVDSEELTEKQRRVELTQALLDGIAVQVQPPQTMALGLTGIESKLSALAFSFFLEVGSLKGLQKCLETFVSFTTDMGTEFGAASFMIKDLRKLLPDWLAQPLLQMDIATDNDEYVAFDAPVPFMPRALVIPGALHICSNLCKDVSKKLEQWQHFLNQLSSLEALLCNRDRRERFMVTCVPRDSEQRALFKSFSGSLYEKRWGAVISFLRKLMPLLGPLRLLWDEGKYVEGYQQRESADDHDAGEGGGVFSPAAITACLQSNFFCVYTTMIMSVLGIVEDLTAWFESCPCHEEGADPDNESRLSRAVRQELQACGTDRFCPMKGKRAPQLAAGCLDETFEEIAIVCRGLVVKALRSNRVSPEDERLLWQDFEAARKYVQLALQIKFDFWQKLPWQLAGLSHPDLDKAREVAKIVLEKTAGFNASDPNLVHHPLTLKLLSPDGSFRPMIQAFAEGQPMPAALHTETSKLGFIPVAERSIEAKHSLITRRVQKNWRTGRVVSLTLRIPDIKAELKADAIFLHDLVQAFALVRDPRKAAHQLGIQNHPDLLDASFARVHKVRLVGILNKIVYRSDLESKFRRPIAARKEHDAHVQKRAKLAEKQMQSMLQDGPREPHVIDDSFNSVLRVAICDHFRVVSASETFGAVYTLNMVPSATGALPVLSSLETVLNSSVRESSCARPPDSVPRLLSDVDTGVDEGPANVQATVHFQVLHTNPSRLKTVPLPAAAGQRLQKGDIAISLHAALPFQQGQTMVALEPLVHGKTSVVVLSHLAAGDLDSLQTTFTKSSLGDLRYSIKGFSPQASPSCSAEITALVRAGAFPDAGKVLEVRLVGGRAPVPWEELEAAGLVTAERARPDSHLYVLSDAGAKALEVASVLTHPKLVCEPREGLPLADCTAYELVRKLMDAGWGWANLPSNRNQRLALQYKAGDAKTWYCPAGSLPHKAYLTCLLECERLELELVPHWSPNPAACYGRLLEGKSLPVQRPRPRLVLRNDVDDAADDAQGDGLPAAPAEAEPPMIEDEVAGDNMSQASSASSLVRELEQLMDQEDSMQDCDQAAVEEPSPMPDAASSSVRPESLPGVSVAGDAVAGGAVAVDTRSAPNSGHAARVAPVARAHLVVPGVVQHWGVFRISSLQPKQPSRPHGALEALCPFHKRSQKSECKKYLSHKSDSPQDKALDLKALKHWCSQARSVHLQRDHVRMKVLDRGALSNLSADFLESKRIDEGPAEDVVPDDIVDAEQRRSAPSAKAKTKAKAKVQSEPSRKSKAKVLAAKAKPAPVSDEEGDHSSSSSSSSSSSGSSSGSSSSSNNVSDSG